jgi:GWxTD domain-containing protein
MVRSLRVFLSLLLSGGLLLGPSTYAQDKQDKKDKSGQAAPQESDKERRAKDKKLLKELDDQYKDWLNVDVRYIITDEERTAFLRLTTNEERESFIENFWNRRNPNPDSVDNEFKEEHYRRIAYANERYASGIPGWKTDRGRIYIIHGKPDEIESHPSGGAYYRPPEEGGGETSTYPWERWRYRYLECCGTDVNLEFVDPSGSGEYHLTIDPAEKDALLYVPGAGLTELEAMGLASKTDRFTRSDGTHVGTSLTQTPARNNQFDRLELYAKVQAAPAVKFRDLEAIVTARLVRNQIHFDYRTDFMRVTPETVMVPITVQIPNRQLTYNAKDDVHSAVVNLFGRVSTLTGRTVQTFEEVISRDFPDSLLQQSLAGSSIYQKSLPLRPGLYRLDLVIKDVQSGNVGVVNAALRVPRYAEDKLESSSMILADQIERVAAKQIGVGQFVMGDSKVRPRMNAEYTTADNLGVYLQVYNVKVDETTHKSDTAIHFSVVRDKEDKPVFQKDETGAQIGQTGDQVTILGMLSLTSLAPGKYKFEIQIKDKLGNQDLLRSAEFTVKPAAPSPKAAASNSPGR